MQIVPEICHIEPVVAFLNLASVYNYLKHYYDVIPLYSLYFIF